MLTTLTLTLCVRNVHLRFVVLSHSSWFWKGACNVAKLSVKWTPKWHWETFLVSSPSASACSPFVKLFWCITKPENRRQLVIYFVFYCVQLGYIVSVTVWPYNPTCTCYYCLFAILLCLMSCVRMNKWTRMWANAQPDGRPAEHRWRPLFNGAKFGWRPLVDAVQ